MRYKIARGGWPWILWPLGMAGGIGLLAGSAGWCAVSSGVLAGGCMVCFFMVYFFRDPERELPSGDDLFVAGADGVVRTVEEMPEPMYLKTDAVRISIFLNPFNVHVNRSPLAGNVARLAYTPGKHLLTIQNAASEYNEHSSILIEGEQTRCLVKQIVGPLVRRVVYWLQEEQSLAKGERIGMMKFGSRLDMYFPREAVDVKVIKGDKVQAGVTVVATLRKDFRE